VGRRSDSATDPAWPAIRPEPPLNVRQFPSAVRRGLRLYAGLYLARRTPVIVYSTGRVGSMALYRSLETAGAFVVTAETLNPDRLVRHKHPGSWRWTYRHIVRPRRPAAVISIVRDPLALLISHFFFKLQRATRIPDRPRPLSIDEMCETFNTVYLDQGRPGRLLAWFETEMKPYLGIDVYDRDFPCDRGFVRIDTSLYRVLIYRAELDDTAKSRAVADFLGSPNFALTRFNVTASKPYARVYASFQRRLKVPIERLDYVYGSRYARHFYSAAERESMRARWS